MKLLLSSAFLVLLSVHLAYGTIGFPDTMSMGFEGTSTDIEFGLLSGAWDPAYGSKLQCIIRCRDPAEINTTDPPANKPSSPDPDFTLSISNPHVFELTPATPKIQFTINYLADNDNSRMDCREKIYFHAACVKVDMSGKELGPIAVDPCDHISEVKDTARMCDDPHIIQKINGLNENGNKVSENICYDLFGKAGDVFELITDEKLDVSVMCKLRDDFYIGATRIDTPLGSIYATSEEISYPGHFKRSWKDVQRVTLGSDPALVIELDKSLTVHVHGSDRKIAIHVQRTVQGYGKSYLNVLVSETSQPGKLLDEHHGGLFGYTANKNYEFIKPVQDDLNAASVKIDNRLVKAFHRTGLGASKCYSIMLDDILYPHTVAKFRKAF